MASQKLIIFFAFFLIAQVLAHRSGILPCKTDQYCSARILCIDAQVKCYKGKCVCISGTSQTHVAADDAKQNIPKEDHIFV
ncbi:hypothetical protein OROGR_014882 [Orobanche gracilis]